MPAGLGYPALDGLSFLAMSVLVEDLWYLLSVKRSTISRFGILFSGPLMAQADKAREPERSG